MTHAGQIALVTGTTHGIGRVTALELARAGFEVVMLCRNPQRAAVMRAEIIAEIPDARIRIVSCDLASLSSVRAAADVVRREVPGIDVLVNNAGIVSTRHRMSVDGFELTFATNHLGPFLLTELLRAMLRPSGRLITVASSAHLRGRLDLGSVADLRARYRPVAAYDRSKLANVMHSFALARRLEGSGVTANCLHPGVVATHLLPRWLQLIKPLISPQMLTEKRGAQTTLYLALSAQVAGVSGRYFDEHQRVQPAAPTARDIQAQEMLWAASERMTGLAAAPGISGPSPSGQAGWPRSG
jgi:NAD(P)-dependent dehydrogenase (short-subunit alcohol dehydrogenase family)